MTVNDATVTQRIVQAFNGRFGSDFDSSVTTANMAEDFPELAATINRPYCFWFLGCVEEQKWDKANSEGRLAQDIPTNHSALFAPTIQPTLRTGVETLCIAALAFLGK